MSKVARFLKFVRNSLSREVVGFHSVVNYDITSRCNLRCQHCYWRKTYEPSKELSDEDWKKAFLEHKAKGVVMGYLTGGEPTLRMPVVRTAYQIFPFIGIVSNGLIKVPEDIQCRIFISIDGPREIHNRIRGADVFDKVMENIENDKRVVLGPTLSTINYRYIDEMVGLVRKSGVEAITFSTYTSHNQSEDPLLLTAEKLDWTIAKLMDVWRKKKHIVYLTPFTIKLFKTKEHVGRCFFRAKRRFIAFDSAMHEKSPCPLGIGVNCQTCGCIVSLLSYALERADFRAWFLFDRLYPERFYKY
jgi:MoaA/NifB/PqqE/SkfB family radical SAM enzyme